jgi:hypothetical protein
MSDQHIAARARAALDAGEGILRLAPTWVPRSFLMPGARLKLASQDLYALGTHRGGIDERWFASTTPAANEGAPEDEGLSYVVHEKNKFTLKDAIAAHGAEMIGEAIWNKYKKWPVYSKFFDNLGPIPHHMHQNAEQAAKLGREGKPESYSTGPATTSPTPSWAWSPAPRRKTSAAASNAGTRETTESWTSPRRIASSPAPAG